MKVLLIAVAIALIPVALFLKSVHNRVRQENAAFATYQQFADSWYKDRFSDMREHSDPKLAAMLNAREKEHYLQASAGIASELRPLDVTITYERGGLTMAGDSAELIGVQNIRPVTAGMVLDKRKVPTTTHRHTVSMHLVEGNWIVTSFQETEVK